MGSAVSGFIHAAAVFERGPENVRIPVMDRDETNLRGGKPVVNRCEISAPVDALVNPTLIGCRIDNVGGASGETAGHEIDASAVAIAANGRQQRPVLAAVDAFPDR